MSIDQTKFFGTATRVFQIAELKRRIKTNIESAKEYFLTYFAKTLNDKYFYCEPQEEGDSLICSMDKLAGTWKGIRNCGCFNTRKWFEEEHDQTFKINADPRAARFYVSAKTGQHYINLSKGFLYKDIKSYQSFSEDVRANVQRILHHIA